VGRNLKKLYAKWGGVGILTILILLGLLMPALSAHGYGLIDDRGYINHEPFRINDNSALQHRAAAEGWSGSGTLFDPYIIEKYMIDATGYSYGIYIGNTTLHFTIRNCLIYNVQNSSGNQYFRGAGILLTNVTYGSVVNNVLHSNRYGLSMVGSSIIYVSDNEIYENKWGIEVTSNYTSLYDNHIYDNDFEGIIIYECGHNTVTNNTLTNNSILLYGSTSALYAQDNDFKKNKIYHGGFEFVGGLETYAFQNIDASNTVNDKPVYYYKNYTENGATISPDAGQIIFANATDLTLSNVHITNTSRAIIVAFSSKISIENSNLSYSEYGVHIEYSSTINLRNNYIFKNQNSGIYLGYSQYDTISSNKGLENYEGIELFHSNNNKIENNLCNYNSHGIDISYGHNNIVMNNSCNYNHISGIEVYQGIDNDIIENICTHNSYYGIYADTSQGSKIHDNLLYFNYNGIYVKYENDDDIYSNNLNSSAYMGISIWHSTVLDIHLNKVENSTQYGVLIVDSTKIRIYDNKFYYNHGSGDNYNSSHIQAYDGGANYWNSTTKGNYWQDWRGPDNDDDGIVDEPYIIDGGSGAKDYYPTAGTYIPEFTYLLPILILLIISLLLLKRNINP